MNMMRVKNPTWKEVKQGPRVLPGKSWRKLLPRLMLTEKLLYTYRCAGLKFYLVSKGVFEIAYLRCLLAYSIVITLISTF